jgi:hypothetical protein
MKKWFLFLLAAAMALGVLHGRNNTRKLVTVISTRIERTNTPVAAQSRSPDATTPWQALDLEDHARLIAELRLSGCPEETIRDLVMMRITRNYYAQLTALEEQRHLRMDWWRSDGEDAERLQSLQDLQSLRHLRRAMKNKVFETLGISYTEMMNKFDGFQRPIDSWLAPERQIAFETMQDRFSDEKENTLGGRVVLMTLNDDQKARLAELEKQQHDELAALLTPAELEAYDLRNSKAAQYVREQLTPAQNEKEFRAMVKVAQDMGATPPEGSGWGVDQTAKQQEAEAQKQAILAKIQESLGAETIAAQQKAEADAKALEAAKKEARSREEFVTELSDMAESVGADRAVGQQLSIRLTALREKLEAMEPTLTNLTAEQGVQLQAQVDAELETIAVETMGDKGHAFMKKFKEQEKSGKH